MFCLNESMRYYLCPGKTDMRKGMNTLSGVIHDKMDGDVRNGDVYIFVNRSRTTMKLLHAETGGLVLYQKRLEEGTFRMPDYDPETKSYAMTWSDLVLMVEGIKEDPQGRLKRLKQLKNYYINS
jgi:transposase